MQFFSRKSFWGVLDRTDLTGLLNRSDWFPLPSERLSPTEVVLPVLETGLTGFRCQQLCRVCFHCVCQVAVGWVLLLGPVALQWLRGLGKTSMRRRLSEISFIGQVLE
jgi:hypothetical protein